MALNILGNEDDMDYFLEDITDYNAMTNEEIAKEFCLSGAFADHYPGRNEEYFVIINDED